MKIKIDAAACTGHGRCYALAPSLFGDDDQGYGYVLGEGVVSGGDEQDARGAVGECPEGAISVGPS